MNNPILPSELVDRKVEAVIGVETQRVTLVVPCFNEEAGLPQLADRLAALPGEVPGLRLRFVLVDDGSTDQTWTAMTALFGGDSRVDLIQHSENLGIAAAIETGVLAASDEIVAVIDSDCTYDPILIGEMVPLLADDVPMVTASPYHDDGEVVGVAPWRIALSQGASRLYRLVLRNKLATYTSCFRVFHRSAMLSVSREHFGFVGVTEMLVRFDQQGWRIREHPATLTTRAFGHSKLSVVSAIHGHLKFLGWIAFARITGQWKSNSPEVRGSYRVREQE